MDLPIICLIKCWTETLLFNKALQAKTVCGTLSSLCILFLMYLLTRCRDRTVWAFRKAKHEEFVYLRFVLTWQIRFLRSPPPILPADGPVSVEDPKTNTHSSDDTHISVHSQQNNMSHNKHSISVSSH